MRYNIPPLPYGYYLGQVIRTYQTTDQNGNERCNIDVDIVYGGWHDYYAMYTEYRGLSFFAGTYSIRVDRVSDNDVRIKDYILQHQGDRILVAIEVGEERYGKENKYRGVTNLYDWRECEKLPAEDKEWAEAHENDDVCDNTPSSYTMLPYALKYAELGFKVLPLNEKGKEPISKSNGCKSATNDPEQIKKWWQENTMYNIGIATEGLVVVDVDIDLEKGKNGDKELIEWQKNNGVLPSTLTATTGRGGKHYLYRSDKKYKNKVGIIKDVDIRAEGGYIVAPPSVHPNGNRYMWDGGLDISKIANADDVVDRLINAGGKVVAADKTTAKTSNNNTIPERKRNDTLYRIGCGMQARGIVDEKIYEELVKTNKERCKPPLEDSEVEKIYNSVIQLPKGAPQSGKTIIYSDDELCGETPQEYIEKIQSEYPYLLVSHYEGKENATGYFRYNIHPQRLAAYFRSQEHYFFVQSTGDKNITYIYNDGVYSICSDLAFQGNIKKYIEMIDEELVEPALIAKVYKLIITDLYNTVQAAQINSDSNIINFQNGILHLDTLALHPHSPDILSTIQIPCDWNPKAMYSPSFNDFIQTLSNGDAEVKQLLWEYIGYAVSNIPGYRCKQALILYGAGNTGKSQYLSLLEKLVGAENYCSISMQQLEMRFGSSALWGKRMAGNADMGSAKIDELEKFKAITGGDTIDFEYKGKDRFSAKYTGMLIFCCNNLPLFDGDRGDHVYERMILLPCNNIIPFAKRDRDLVSKLYGEREAIIYHSIIALKKLIERGGYFDEPDVCAKAREMYQATNDNVKQFIVECTDGNLDRNKHNGIAEYTKTAAMFDYYKLWCCQSGYPAANRREFRKGIENHFHKNIENIEFTYNGTKFYPFTLKTELRQQYYPYS